MTDTLLEHAIAKLRALPAETRDAAAAGVLTLLAALEGEALLDPDELEATRLALSRPREDVPEEEMRAFFAARRAP